MRLAGAMRLSGAGHELVGEIRLDGLAILHRAERDQDLLGLLDVLGRNPGERLALAALRGVEREGELENPEMDGAVERGRTLQQCLDRALRIALGRLQRL